MTQRKPDGEHSGGRRKSEKRQRQKIVAVRFTDTEYAALERAAKRTGRPASRILRETFLALPRETGMTVANPDAPQVCTMTAQAGVRVLTCDLPVRAQRHFLGQHHDPVSGLIWSAQLATIMNVGSDSCRALVDAAEGE